MRALLIFVLTLVVAGPARAALETVVVTIDGASAPKHAAWVEAAAALIRKHDANITQKLSVKGITPPRAVTLTIDEKMKGVAATSGARIRIAAEWIQEHPDDWGMVIHEYTHVVQSYPKYKPAWLIEGIADYVRFYMFESEARRPNPNPAQSNFNDGYRTTAAFLAWIEATHAPNIIEHLNTALRTSRYTDTLIAEITGHTFPALWKQFADSKKPVPKTQRKEPPVSKGLNIVSYNIRHGAGMDLHLNLDRSTAIIERLGPDIVALQEVDMRCSRSGSIDQASELGKRLGMRHAFGKFMDYQGGEYGLAVLSRYPIRKIVRHELPTGAEPRCALEVEVQPPQLKTPLSFVCVHMDWTEAGIRLTQMNALLKAISDRKHPVILAGDFNASPEETSMQRLRDTGWSIVPKKPPVNTWPANTPKVEIDYIVTRGLDTNTICTVVEEAAASDHRPIQVRISLEPITH